MQDHPQCCPSVLAGFTTSPLSAGLYVATFPWWGEFPVCERACLVLSAEGAVGLALLPPMALRRGELAEVVLQTSPFFMSWKGRLPKSAEPSCSPALVPASWWAACTATSA